MKISDINNNANFTAKLEIKGITKNISEEKFEKFCKKAAEIGSSRDTIEINILRASEKRKYSFFDFSGIMAKLNIKTNIRGEKDISNIKSPNETSCISQVLESLKGRYSKK